MSTEPPDDFFVRLMTAEYLSYEKLALAYTAAGNAKLAESCRLRAQSFRDRLSARGAAIQLSPTLADVSDEMLRQAERRTQQYHR